MDAMFLILKSSIHRTKLVYFCLRIPLNFPGSLQKKSAHSKSELNKKMNIG